MLTEYYSDVEAEKAVIALLTMGLKKSDRVFGRLKTAEYFADKTNKKIYEAILNLAKENANIDLVTILGKFDGDEKAYIKDYLTNLITVEYSLNNVESYVKMVEDKYDLRDIANLSFNTLHQSKGKPVDEVISMLNSKVDGMSKRRVSMQSNNHSIQDVIVKSIDFIESDRKFGLNTGFDKVDEVLYGLNKGHLIIIAARPGVGKTSFALNIATNVAKKHKVLFFSLEMSIEQLGMKIISSFSGINQSRMRYQMSTKEWSKITEHEKEYESLKMVVNDESHLKISKIIGEIKNSEGVELVIIDYLQLIEAEGKFVNKVQEVSDVTRRLKIAAKEYDIPIICLAQLSRACEQRQRHEPLLSDLRDSGSIEQDADSVILLYRPEMYEGDKYEGEGVCECRVAKNRHGETRNIILHFDGQHSKFH